MSYGGIFDAPIQNPLSLFGICHPFETGMLEVISADSQFSTCKVIDGGIEDMKPGDRVY